MQDLQGCGLSSAPPQSRGASWGHFEGGNTQVAAVVANCLFHVEPEEINLDTEHSRCRDCEFNFFTLKTLLDSFAC